ncbi:MAG: acetyl-CoA carboxylase biotin carboxyl carrier protein [Planctomycetota bacterium]|nr:MAG: acetyl-CoA carboxylase biotin carboxyl carrier protein [Planctomycetota bacterium]
MSEKEETRLRKVKQLIELMKENDLVELEIVDGDSKILLKRPQPAAPTITQIPMVAPAAAAPVAAPAGQEGKVEGEAEKEDQGIIEIKSPIVGTFYSAPSPDSKPYVAVGSEVRPDTVVCIVEAMKVMNEIKAETYGTIVEIACEVGEAVEYGQVLFKVRPD